MKTWKFCRDAAVCIAAMILTCGTSTADTYTNYVALTGSDDYSGASWGDAYRTLTNALTQASSAINGGASDAAIYVDTGVYTQSVELVVTQAIAIIGKGGVGVDDSLQSIIRQTNTVRGISLSNANARLQGLVIENGYITNTTLGGNVLLGDGLISNCVIRNNRYYLKLMGGTGSSGNQKGGGIYMAGGLVVASVISGNGIGHYDQGFNYSVSSAGGGVYVAGGTLRRSVVVGNSICVHVDRYGKPALGAGIYLDGPSAIVESCLVVTNQSYNSSPTGEATWMGAGVYLKAGTLRNCTIVTNLITSSNGITPGGVTREGAGVYQAGGTSVNCIVWGNFIATTNLSGSAATNYYLVSGQNVKYSCAPELTAGEGNKTEDPLFVAPGALDYQLSRTSPCIDAGTNELDWMSTAKDLGGHPRIMVGTVDMGAYEVIPLRGTMIIMN